MFEKMFAWIREGVKNAVLGGIQDAHEEITLKLEASEPITIEATVEPESNGHKTPKRRTISRS